MWSTQHCLYKAPYGMPSHSSNLPTASAHVQNQAAVGKPAGESPPAWEAWLYQSFSFFKSHLPDCLLPGNIQHSTGVSSPVVCTFSLRMLTRPSQLASWRSCLLM